MNVKKLFITSILEIPDFKTSVTNDKPEKQDSKN